MSPPGERPPCPRRRGHLLSPPQGGALAPSPPAGRGSGRSAAVYLRRPSEAWEARGPRYPGPVHVHAERGGSELAKFSESCLSLFWLSLNCGGGNICETCSTAASKAPRRSESGGGDGGHLPPAPPLCAPPPRTPPTGHPGTALVTRGLAYLLLGAPSPWKAAAVGALALPYWRGHGHRPLPSAGTTEIWGHWLRNAHGSINR